jgi:hypothetical protein
MTAPHSRVWRWVLAASVVGIGAADAIVLDLVRAYFGSGYNGVALHGGGEIAAFFAIGAVFDVAAVAAVWSVVLGLARLLRARPLRALAAAALAGVALPLAFDLVLHRLHRVLGDVLELRLLLNLAAGSWTHALGEAAQDLPPLALLLLASLAGAAACFAAISRIERSRPGLAGAELPRLGRLAAAASVCGLVGIAVLAASATLAPALEVGWSAKPAGRALRGAVSALSDFDADGYGWLSEPPDSAPFDAALHPYALDVAGNGIDEDGVAGDLPADVAVPRPISVPPPGQIPGAPSVVLIFLESFRADLVGLRDGALEVTPNLNRLARAGTLATAYAHVPVTWASRGSLLQGRVAPTPAGDGLVDDFLARGYEVAWFSGQHDGLAIEDARLGIERATPFVDAREDVDRRTSRSAQPISLQVSWKTVTGRVRTFLKARRSPAPLFLYVNIVDTHFPYWHRELDDVLGVGELPRDAIRPENRERVWRAYLNAAANVDRAIGEVVQDATAALGTRTLVVVTGDHGQSFYENGLLGHGQALDDAQSAVPFLANTAIALPQPLALSDVRGLVGHWLAGRAAPESERSRREIFQHVGALETPSLVGLRSQAGVTSASPAPGGPALEGAGLRAVQAWEALVAESSNAKRRRL